MTEVGGQRSEDRGQRSEVRGQMTEFGSGNAAFDELRRNKVGKGQNKKYSCQRSDGRWQRTEDRISKSESGSRNAAFGELRRDKVGKKTENSAPPIESEIGNAEVGIIGFQKTKDRTYFFGCRTSRWQKNLRVSSKKKLLRLAALFRLWERFSSAIYPALTFEP